MVEIDRGRDAVNHGVEDKTDQVTTSAVAARGVTVCPTFGGGLEFEIPLRFGAVRWTVSSNCRWR